MRAVPVKYRADPLLEVCEPLLVMVSVGASSFDTTDPDMGDPPPVAA